MFHDLTHGNITKSLLLFALPMMAGNLLQQFYNIADTIIVGRILGENALAAVGSAYTLMTFLTSIFIGLSLGSGALFSIYRGKQDQPAVRSSIFHAFVLIMGVTLLLNALVYLFLNPILTFLRVPANVWDGMRQYLLIIFAGLIASALYNFFACMLRALGNSTVPLVFLAISSILNIALDLLFIAGFHWGVWSAAVATTISQAISMVLCLIHLSKKGMPYQLQWRKLRFDREMLGQMVRYGLPSGVQNSVIGLANVILQSNINSFGKLAMAGYGAYSKLEGFAFLPITSFTMALTTYTGQNLGAMQYDRAKKGARFGILVSITLAELIGVGMYVFAPQLISIFTPTPEVIALGTQQARTIALFYCLLAYSHAVASVCRGAGKAFVPMTIMLATWCALRIVYITTVMHIVHEIQYIYWAYPLTWSVSSVIYFIYYHRSDWIHGFEAKEH